MRALANQHYVWAHYLDAWAENRFFCWRQSEKKLFPGQPKVEAKERDFYKTCRLANPPPQRYQASDQFFTAIGIVEYSAMFGQIHTDALSKKVGRDHRGPTTDGAHMANRLYRFRPL
ncbi:DUF4238 domain-containing protein [Bradyrhizobium genomosp. I (2014)]|uniref:DUF4238 domain-containing protein n=1 Tax=Bradyrhizobium genomosp. I (2014) TaxID=2683269 RepID=UPI0005566221|nr:DUF4238 domain-containing protein [Bradyrhizobium sp. CCBAU 43298]